MKPGTSSSRPTFRPLDLRCLAPGMVVAASLAFAPPSGAAALSTSGMDSAFVGPSVDLNDFGSRFLARGLRDRLGASMSGALLAAPGTDTPLGGWNETTVAVDPNNPMHIACASIFDMRVSTDGGTTWQPPIVPVVPSTHVEDGDPCLAFDAEGRLFWSYLGSPLGAYFSAVGIDLFIAECDPATGEILPGYPVNVTAGVGLPASAGYSHDKEWLAVDAHPGSPFANRLYLVWTEFPPSNVEVTMTSWSSDHGLTWSSPVQLGAPGTGSLFVWPAHITVAPNGDVYAAEHRQPGFVSSAPDGVSGFVNVYRSTDGGVSFPQQTQPFTAGQADITFNVQTSGAHIPNTSFLLQGSVQPWVLADPNVAGRIYVVANDDPDNDHNSGDPANVYLAISTDYGATWGPPARVDGGPGTSLQAMPTAAIDPITGTLVVSYYDDRGGAMNSNGNFLLDVYAAVSTDGGLSFLPDFRINDDPFDPDAGARCRYDCGQLATDVWAGTGGVVYATGQFGALIVYNGAIWNSIGSSTTTKFGLWGSSNTNVYYVAAGGEIGRYNGSMVQPQSSHTSQNLYGIDGRGPNDIFAVGGLGTIVHFDGVSWSVQASGTTQDLHQVWANPTGDAIAVGRNGTVLRYNGSSWAPMSPGNTDHLFGVWGTSDSDFYVTSVQGGRYHWNGGVWSPEPTGEGALTDIWGTSGSDIYEVGFGRVGHFDGSAWSPRDFSEHLLVRMAGTSASNVYVTGEQGTIAHFDGSAWTRMTNPFEPTTPTKRIGEYNGVAAAAGRSYAVWCGNTFDGSVPRDQQAIFDAFDTAWQVGVSLFDPLHHSSTVTLERPAPNPTRSASSVAYSLPRAAAVELSVVDLAGRRVATLIRGHQPAGRHVASWNATDVPPGVYFLHLRAGGEERRQTAIVLH